MKINLSDNFSYKKLIRFTLPSITMMIFVSIYGVVDGFFVSNFVGKTPFAAVNFIYPLIMILGSFGFMFGTGGNALISKTMGEGDMKKAKSLFSLLTFVSALVGIALALIGIIIIKPVAILLGASGDLLHHAVIYGIILLAGTPFFMLQQEFQSFFVTAGKPTLGLWTTIAAGVTNIVLDALFIAVFKWGVIGAASATVISQIVGGVIPIIYFSKPNSSLLSFTKFSFDGKSLLKTATNGSSELVNNASMSLVSMLYNFQLMRFAGENGVAAYGVLMYVCLIFLSVFIGYSIGTAPIIGYHYGAQNHGELKSLLKKSIFIFIVSSVIMFLLGEFLAKPLSVIFVGYDNQLLSLTERGFKIFSFQFLFCGFAIFGSSFFTALNNGLISATISFMRTLVFQIASVLLLPLLFKTDGIWLSIVVAEILSLLTTVLFLIKNKKRYKY